MWAVCSVVNMTNEDLELDVRRKIIMEYRPDVEKLMPYLSWMEERRGKAAMSSYEGEGAEKTSFTFPVYDSTLLGFIKTAQKTKFMNRNYQYVYSRRRIRTVKQEIDAIQNTTLRDMEVLSGIFSHYVMGGMTKGTLWSEAVENGVFAELLRKMRELVLE